MIEVEGLTKLYREFVAVSELSFTVQSARCWVSWAQTAQAKHDIAMCGRHYSGDPWDGPHLQLRCIEGSHCRQTAVAFFPDEPRLFDYLTVAQHLTFTARIYQVPNYQEIAQPLMKNWKSSTRLTSFPVNFRAE